MEPLASSPGLPAYVESAEASEGPSEAGEGSRLGALLIVLTPFALAAWFAIGLAVYRAVTWAPAPPRPGGVETVSVDVLGPERTITDRQFVTETQVVDRTQTDVVTEIQPTTVVVTDVRTETVREVETQHVTVVQTETVVVTETVTVTVPPPP